MKYGLESNGLKSIIVMEERGLIPLIPKENSFKHHYLRKLLKKRLGLF